MLRKNVTYEDLNGDMATETLYFNISPAEVTKLKVNGVFEDLAALVRAKPGDERNALEALERFIALAYGEKTADGRRIHKDPQQSEDFLSSPAYGALFTELIGGGESEAITFITGILPGEFKEQLLAELSNQGTGLKVDIPAESSSPTTQGIKVNSITLPEPSETNNVPPAFRAKTQEQERAAARHGRSGDPRKRAVVVTPEPESEQASFELNPALKPILQMTEEELRTELAKLRSTN